MDGYPTIEQLLQHEEHARKMAEEYRSEGNFIKAEMRDEDATFYGILARREEARLEKKA